MHWLLLKSIVIYKSVVKGGEAKVMQELNCTSRPRRKARQRMREIKLLLAWRVAVSEDKSGRAAKRKSEGTGVRASGVSPECR